MVKNRLICEMVYSERIMKVEGRVSEMGIRNSAKAVIVKEGKLLTIKIQENGETYYILPGGGQEHGENLHQALERECKEELGALIEIGELIFVREYIGKNHELSSYHSHVHQTEFMFLCNVYQDKFDNGIILTRAKLEQNGYQLTNC